MTEDATRSDGELLGDFAATGNEAAFGELVSRHGPMVHSVCRRVLSDHHEAEDVAQAVFLTMAKKARGLKGDSSVGGWLHRVAWCLAMDVRKARERRNRHEEAVMREARAEEIAPVDTAVFRAELDAAVAGLPDRFRQPVVLFHLEERSAEEATRTLGLNPVTLRTRLVRAREMLRAKLMRRGVAIGSVGALTTLFSAEAGAAVLPATFVSATVKAAGLAAAGKLAAGVGAGAVSANVAALTKGAVNMLFWSSVKTAAIAVAVTGAVVTTGTVVAQKVATGADIPQRVVPNTNSQAGVALDDLPDYEIGPYPHFANLSKDEQEVLRKADETFAARKFSEAMRPYDSFIHDYPKSLAVPYVLILRGRCYDKIGDFARAQKTYQDIQDYFPTNIAYCAPSLFYQARIAVKNGDLVRAKQRLAILEKDDQYNKHPVIPVARRLKAIIEKIEGTTKAVTTFSESNNGQTVTIPVGQLFEVHLTNDREGAGWEPGATEITGKSVARVDKLRRMNCDEFLPADPSTNSTKGTYIYRYKAATTGESNLRLTHLYPSGPKPVMRDATMFIGEFKLVVRGTEAPESGLTGKTNFDPVRLESAPVVVRARVKPYEKGTVGSVGPSMTRFSTLVLTEVLKDTSGQALAAGAEIGLAHDQRESLPAGEFTAYLKTETLKLSGKEHVRYNFTGTATEGSRYPGAGQGTSHPAAGQ